MIQWKKMIDRKSQESKCGYYRIEKSGPYGLWKAFYTLGDSQTQLTSRGVQTTVDAKNACEWDATRRQWEKEHSKEIG